MKCKTIVLWWLVNGTEPPGLPENERKIEALMPLVSALFPGINYFSITGFGKVMRDCAIPALKKRHPELLDTPAEKIGPNAMTEVAVVLPSDGYEWQDSAKWQSKLRRLLAAA